MNLASRAKCSDLPPNQLRMHARDEDDGLFSLFEFFAFSIFSKNRFFLVHPLTSDI
jgi:hypothetical protein